MLAVNRIKDKKVPQKAQKNPKHEKIDQLNILDKCTQILKDDRLILRNLLKDGNQEIDTILLKHKKNTDWLSLQTDLRKYLNKLKGKNIQTANTTRSQSRPAKENVEVTQSHIHLKKEGAQISYSQDRKPLINTQERQNNFFQLKVNSSPQVNNQLSPSQQQSQTVSLLSTQQQKTSNFNAPVQKEEPLGQKSPQFHEVNEEDQKSGNNNSRQYQKSGNNMLFGQYNYNMKNVIEEQQEEQRDSSYQGSNPYSHFQTQQNENCCDDNLQCAENIDMPLQQQQHNQKQQFSQGQQESLVDPPHSQNQLATHPDICDEQILNEKQMNNQCYGEEEKDLQVEEDEEQPQLSIRQSFANAQNPQVLGENSEDKEQQNDVVEENTIQQHIQYQQIQMFQQQQQLQQQLQQQKQNNYQESNNLQQQDDDCNVDNMCLTLESEQQQQQQEHCYEDVRGAAQQDDEEQEYQEQDQAQEEEQIVNEERQQQISQLQIEEQQQQQEIKPLVLQHLQSFNRNYSHEECPSPITPMDQPVCMPKKHLDSPLKQRIEEQYEKEEELVESEQKKSKFSYENYSNFKNTTEQIEEQAQALEQIMLNQRLKNKSQKSLKKSDINSSQIQEVEVQKKIPQPDFTEAISPAPVSQFQYNQQYFINKTSDITQYPPLQQQQPVTTTVTTNTIDYQQTKIPITLDPNNVIGMKLTKVELELLQNFKNNNNTVPTTSTTTQFQVNVTQANGFPGAVPVQSFSQSQSESLSNFTQGAHQQARINYQQPLVNGATQPQLNSQPFNYDWSQSTTTTVNNYPLPQPQQYQQQPQVQQPQITGSTFLQSTSTTGLNCGGLTTLPRSSFYNETPLGGVGGSYLQQQQQYTLGNNSLLQPLASTTTNLTGKYDVLSSSLTSSYIIKQQQQTQQQQPLSNFYPQQQQQIDTSYLASKLTQQQQPIVPKQQFSAPQDQQDPIKLQYKDLFTSPELLQQCRADIQFYNQNKKLPTLYGQSVVGVRESSNSFLNVVGNSDTYTKQSQTLLQSPSNQSNLRGTQYSRNNQLFEQQQQQQVPKAVGVQGSGTKQSNYDVERVYQHLFTNWDLLLGANKSGRKSATKRSAIKQDQVPQQQTNQFVAEPVSLNFSQTLTQQQQNVDQQRQQQQAQNMPQIKVTSPTNLQSPVYQQTVVQPVVVVQQQHRNSVEILKNSSTTNTTTTAEQIQTEKCAQLHLDDFLGACTKTNYCTEANVTSGVSNEKIVDGMLYDGKMQNIKESLVHQISSTNDLQHGVQLSISPVKVEKVCQQQNNQQLEQQQQVQNKGNNNQSDYMQLINSTEAQIMSQKCDFPVELIDQMRQKLYLYEITAEDLFDEIFTDSSLAKISKAFFRFKLETIVLELSNEKCQVKNEDIDMFFEHCDLKKDGFLDVNELGPAAKVFCQEKDIQENAVQRVFDVLDTEQKGYLTRQDLERTLSTLQSEVQVDPEDSINPAILVKELFDEVDSHKKGFLTYWDIYLCKNTYQFKRIINLFERN